MGWPPQVGDVLPRAEECFGLRDKLSNYSLNPAHERGFAKARGFETLLGVTVADLEYLEATIRIGIRGAPIGSIRDNSPYGVLCAVDIAVRGVREKASRSIGVCTVWELADREAAPRLVSAYVKP